MNEHLCFLVGLHFSVCSQHYCRGSGPFFIVPASSELFFFFAHHVHRCSWINHEFSLLGSFWSRCRHYLCFNRSTERSSDRILELVSVFRHFPRCFAGASFWVQGLLMWSFSSNFAAQRLRSWGAHFWMIPRDGPCLSRISIWCHVIQTHGRAHEFTWRIFTEFEAAWNFTLIKWVVLFTAWSLWGFFLSLAVSLFCLRMGCRRRRSSFLSLSFATVSRDSWMSWLKLHEPPLEHCPCAFHWKHSPTFFSTWAFFPFLTLGDWSPFHNIALDSEVSSSHHLINMKFLQMSFYLLIVRLLGSRRFLIILSHYSLKLSRVL